LVCPRSLISDSDVYFRRLLFCRWCPRTTDEFGVAIKSLYGLLCHLQNIVSLADLQRISGLPLFASGPHLVETNDGTQYPLDSDSRIEFGHYNPEFVRWAVDNLIPSEGIARLGPVERVYDEAAKEQARIWYQAYRDLHADPEFLAEASADYAAKIESYVDNGEEYDWNAPGVSVQNRYSTYAAIMLRQSLWDDVLQDKSYMFREFYRYRMAVGFWLRREMDGTAPIFLEGLEKVMRVFDPGFLERVGDAKTPLDRTREHLVGIWINGDQPIAFDGDGTYRSTHDNGTWEVGDLDFLIMGGEQTPFSIFYDSLLHGSRDTRRLLLTLDGTEYRREASPKP
ncbi:MAG: hypothetical protein AAF637_14380, partial [Pseudomonadota bacterium]